MGRYDETANGEGCFNMLIDGCMAVLLIGLLIGVGIGFLIAWLV